MVAVILLWILQIYTWILFARVIGSWILYFSRSYEMPAALRPIWSAILAVTDPPLRFLGRWIKPVRVGEMSIDLAFLALFVIIWVLQFLIGNFLSF